jgi:hypothetical protein
MKQKHVKVKVLMRDRLQVIGTVTMPSNSYHSRLSDLINNNQNFLVLTDVTVYENGSIVSHSPFLCINKQTIVFLAEDEEATNNLNSLVTNSERG